MLRSFSRMVSELLRHSDRKDVLELIKPHLRDAHRPRAVQRDDATAVEDEERQAAQKKKASAALGPQRGGNLWETELSGIGPDVGLTPDFLLGINGDEEADEALLDSAGF